MTTQSDLYDQVYKNFKEFVQQSFRMRSENGSLITVVPSKAVPSEILQEMINLYGVSVLYLDAANRRSPAVRIDDLAELVIRDRNDRGLFMLETSFVGAESFSVSHWLLKTLEAEVARVEVKVPPWEFTETWIPDAPMVKKPRKSAGVQLVQMERVEAALAECHSGDRDSRILDRKALLTKLKNQPVLMPQRVLNKHFRALDSLLIDFPHFHEVIAAMSMDLKLQMATRGTLVLEPTLLVGPPGVGKTEFVRQVARRLNCGMCPISAGSATAGFVLRGMHRNWASASAGDIARQMLQLRDRQGLVVLLDELDKVVTEGRNHPIEPILLDLLEPGQNCDFVDEFLGLGLNLTPFVSFIATANVLGRVSAPLQSRLRVFEVPVPSKSQMPAVTRSLDRMIREERPKFAQLFAPLSDEVIAELQSTPPRELRRILMGAYTHALNSAARGKRTVGIEEIRRAMRSSLRAQAQAQAQAQAARADAHSDSEETFVMTFAIKSGGNGGVPPTSTVH